MTLQYSPLLYPGLNLSCVSLNFATGILLYAASVAPTLLRLAETRLGRLLWYTIAPNLRIALHVNRTIYIGEH